MLDTYGMVIIAFSIVDKANQVRFFEEIFLMTNVCPKVIFGIFFLTLSGRNIDFSGQELQWRTYITEKALATTRHVELVRNKKFAAVALNPKYETFVIHIASLSSTPLVTFLSFTPLNADIHPFHKPQISSLIAEGAFTIISNKYIDFIDIFSPDLASKLPKHIGINEYTIKLVDD